MQQATRNYMLSLCMRLYFLRRYANRCKGLPTQLKLLLEELVSVSTVIFLIFSRKWFHHYLWGWSLETECTYSHFEQSSECPTCRRRLGENDFTELVVADSNGSDIAKSNMQTLFSKKSSSGCLHYSDVCQSLIQQIECSKQSTKFLLKQLLVESHRAGRTSMAAARTHESLRTENTQLKQANSTLRLQYEQTINDLQNKLKARESTISEMNHMLNNFQKIHGVRGGGGVAPHMVPNSSSASVTTGQGSGPPLRGLIAQREANMKAQQNTLNGAKLPFMNSMNANRNKSPANFRPFSSSNSSCSGSIAPRVRDLTANSAYHFTGISNQNLNKRRRGGTPTLQGTSSPHHLMSPNTAFVLNQGPHVQNMFHGQR